MPSSNKSRSGGVNKWILDENQDAMIRIIQFEKKINGVVFQRNHVDFEKNIFGCLNDACPIEELNDHRSKVAWGIVRVLDDGVYLKICVFPGPHGDVLKKCLELGIGILPIGTGRVVKGKVLDYKLLSFYPAASEAVTTI